MCRLFSLSIFITCLCIVAAEVHGNTKHSAWVKDGKPKPFDWTKFEATFRQHGTPSALASSTATIGGHFFRGISTLSNDGATQYFVSTTYAIDNTTVAGAAAIPLNLCLLYPYADNYEKFTIPSSTDTTITITDSLYKDSTCSELIKSTDRIYEKEMGLLEAQDCAHGPYDDDYGQYSVGVRLTYSIVSNKNPFYKLGAGSIYLTYDTLTGCKDEISIAQSFDAAFSCETSVKNSYCLPANESVTIQSSTKYTFTKYTSKECNHKLYSDALTLYDDTCVQDTTDDDRHTIYYSSSFFQGGSSDDDDNVSLSQSEYGGLIASVFIALVFGIACTIGLFCFGIISVGKNGTANKALIANQL